MTQPEFARPVPLDRIGAAAQAQTLKASPRECAALAHRFGLVRLDRLTAKLSLSHDGETIRLEGRFSAAFVQSCAASGVELPVTLDEPLAIRFVAAVRSGEEEIELDAADCDTMEHDGLVVDVGEAVAQSLGLAIDPFLRSDDADHVLRAAGVKSESEAGPFAALAALKGKPG